MKAFGSISRTVRRQLNRGPSHLRCFSSSSYFTIEKKTQGVAVVKLESKNAPVNTIGSKVFPDFTTLISTVESDPTISSVVFLSAKPNSFIAGADISELDTLKTVDDAVALSKNGQEHISLLAQSNVHFISAINGTCLGGGLEFALACDYRIASSARHTKLGLPEVQLGLLPGAGGTQRLPKLVGIQNAIKLCTTGQQLDSKRALRMGLVDEVADPNALEEAAIQAALRLMGGEKKKKKKSNLMTTLLEGNPLGRWVLFDQAAKMAGKKTQGNYPAIPLILESIKVGVESGLDAGMKVERESFGKLIKSPESEALRGLFFGSTALKKNRFATKELDQKFKGKKIDVGVLGAGLMGAGIAQVSAQSGSNVVVKDLNLKSLARGEKQIEGNFATKVKRRRMAKHDMDKIMSRIDFVSPESHDPALIDQKLSKCDVVIEAVLEDLKLKHIVVNDLERILPSTGLIGTNTSALRLSDIESVMKPENKKNLVGLHYFSPVDKMPLLEIIPGPNTSEEAKYIAMKLGLQQKKTCIVVKDVAGFFVNRCLGPYLAEVTEILTNPVAGKVELAQLDKMMVKYGFPVGPISLIDEVGLDVALHVQESLLADAAGVGQRMSSALLLEKLVQQGHMGKKSGNGLFSYEKGKKGPKVASKEAIKAIAEISTPGISSDTIKPDPEEMQNRMAFKFINEAMFCLQDGVIANVQDGDIGSVFGVGFPPFKGGPFREVDRIGARQFVDTMYAFRDKFGTRFEPAQIAVDYANSGKKFHSK